jgi:hypothetical protein
MGKGGWSIETIAEIGGMEFHTDLELDSSGKPHISFYDISTHELKYAKWTGTAWDIQIVDPHDVGWFNSLALDSNDVPHISYYNQGEYPPPQPNADLKYARILLGNEDFLGNWGGAGVWYRNSETSSWVKQGPPGELINAGDLDGDGTDDILWSNTGDGVWVKHSTTGTWMKLSNAPALDLASGDMNGDGRVDLVGNWSSGVYYKSSIGGAWVMMGPVGGFIGTGDLDGDGTDDLLWSKMGDGVWVKNSTTGTWSRICVPTALDISSGDMSGDGKDDLVGIWIQGVYYKDSKGGGWVKIGPLGDLIATGDLDGDGVDDLLWSDAASGVWIKHSTTVSWTRLTIAAAGHMDAGVMRGGANPWPSVAIEGFVELPAPIGGYSIGPGSLSEYEDFSDEGPGGWNFVFSEEANLDPQDADSAKTMRIPGPGETGFVYIEQENLFPQETGLRNKTKNN